ncbi:MAG: RNA polymerase factor sigma-54 [Chromatiales bacterium]|jgi:RNA polymerase sigma-54 factor
MKQSIQLRLGQQLTMTPQLQQAIRLLQLSALDLRQEIQEALDSNLMLETEEEAAQAQDEHGSDRESLASGEGNDPSATDREPRESDTDREIDVESASMPDDLPVDTRWDDVYESGLPPSGGSARQSDGEDTDFLAQRSKSQTLHDYLAWQLNLTPMGETDRAIAETIIDAVSEDGYLTLGLEDLHASLDEPELQLEEVEAVLHRIQAFDPPGVAARDPRECLLIQLGQLPGDVACREQAIRLVRDHFGLLAAQDFRQIKRRLRWEDEDLRCVNQLIRSLNPRPGTLIADAEPQYVIPDVIVTKRRGQWHVELNAEATPRLRVNPYYERMVRRADQSDDNVYLRNHLQEARWFIKSLQSRNETLLKVATAIVEFQRGFFDYGEEAMRPLVLRDVAESLEMHESTISRVTSQKYMYTPRGTYEFKYFFSSHVSMAGGGECSATAIRALIKKLVAAEQATRPLSDNKIAQILADQGIDVARRTVAKYRESMAIPPSNERKRLV